MNASKPIRLIALVCLTAAAALSAGQGRIAFITFCVKGDSVRIVSAELADGNLKRSVIPPQGNLECLLLSAGGDTLFSILADDPALPRRVEYGDPSGKIADAMVSGLDSTFVVRLPLPPGAARLALSRSRGKALGAFRLDQVPFKKAGGR